MLPTVEESRGYDFQDIENAGKWKGLFVISLKKVSEQVHPTLTVEESALQYVESLCLRLLAMLCAVPSPLTVQDVEERVARLFPTPMDKWAIKDAHETAALKRKKTTLPLDRIHQMLQKEVLQYKIDMSVSVFMTAIIEYISADIFKLAGNFVKKISQKSGYSIVTCSDIKTAMCADKVLMDMFHQDSELAACAAGAERRGRRGSLTYAELVRDLITDVRSFLRDLHLLIRVFKAELDKILENDHQLRSRLGLGEYHEAISLIFGNIMDIYEVTVTLLGNLEDAIEMSQDAPAPLIGGCFEELAEVEEFRCYVRYANTVTSKESREALQKIVDDPETAERLDTAGHGFRLCVKYYLPRLLLACVAHVLLYHADVLSLLQIAEQSDDRESFKQVECNLHPIKKLLLKALENGPKIDGTLRMATRARRQLAVDKCAELSRTVDNWDVRDIGQCCNEFIREDTLSKLGPGKRIAERRAYLFDGLLLLCKPVTSLVTVNSGSQLLTGGSNSGGIQLKLKEKLFIRKVEIVDRPDTDEGRHCLELCPRVGPPVVLSCSSCAEKRNWMCDLVMLNTKPMLDRALDSILLDLERRHPLKLPPPTLYRFAVPDSPDNLLLEERRAAQAPVIKGATLLKLVERLTYHIYADLKLVRTFLTTYRSFCSPEELLALLIERFKIPEPSAVYDTPAAEATETAASDAEKLSKNSTREDWKRYRKEFEQPVKFRVINVLRHWVDQHFYDFEREPALLETLKEFLLSVDGKPMKKWVQSVLKTIQRKSQAADDGEWGVLHVFDKPAPPVLRHVSDPDRCGWHPLALHPVELARQLTTIEFQLYRQVKPSELVGAVWTKKDKEKTSPNLLRIIKHTTNFTRWMEKWIVESENVEERVGVVCRLLEVCAALTELNNFNAVLAVVAAFGGASVHRLKTTLQMVPPRLYRTLEESRSLNSDHFRRYQERLRSINPPCVPFLGMYLTNILHIEEGNLDYLPNSELINFSKRRKVAEITGEIQQYQNQPYCLTVEPRTRAFLESLDPFPDMNDNEITNYLYEKSLEIEPRQPVKQVAKCPRKYPELSLKPVKVSRRRHDDAAHHSVSSNDDNLSVSQLSPTSSNWDGSSVSSFSISSFSIMSHDDRTSDRGSLVSPRLERSSSNTFSQLSLFDKGLALFDKTKSQVTSSRASISGGSMREEPPSPRDRHSPRHERHPSAERRPQALSPRNAIVDAELFYSRSMDHLNSRRQDQERVPPLLPRNSITSGWGAEEKPPLPKRASSPTKSPTDTAPPPPAPAPADPPPPEPPERGERGERPLPSPKPQPLNRMPAISPKRSPAPAPAPAPPISPLVSSADSRAAASPALSVASAFSFPATAPPPPTTPHPTPRPSPSLCGTPPPLPPRRRRDLASDVHDTSMSLTPPPVPPRPTPAPELLRPAHSTILQRRHSSNNNIAPLAAPKLPPKPHPPHSAPPRTS